MSRLGKNAAVSPVGACLKCLSLEKVKLYAIK